jgi:hypothetical protein
MRPYLVTQPLGVGHPLGNAVVGATAPPGSTKKQVDGTSYNLADPEIADLVIFLLSDVKILSEGPLVRPQGQCASICVDSKEKGTPAASPWITARRQAGDGILAIDPGAGSTGTICATRNLALVGALTAEAPESIVLYEPSGGWGVAGEEAAPAAASPSWWSERTAGQKAMIVGGLGLLIVGLGVGFARSAERRPTRHTPNSPRRRRRRRL